MQLDAIEVEFPPGEVTFGMSNLSHESFADLAARLALDRPDDPLAALRKVYRDYARFVSSDRATTAPSS